MVGIIRKIAQIVGRFKRETRAVAAVEFALILPALLFTYIGTAEVSRAIIMDRRLAVVAGSVADLVARADGSITHATLNDYFKAAEFTMKPYPSGSLKQVVTSVYVDKKGKAKVRWSKGYNGGSTHKKNSTFTLPKEMQEQSKKKYLIVGEATVQWTPIVDFIFKSGITLNRTYYFRPRFDAEISLK